jgi:addiction module HigA family antidote
MKRLQLATPGEILNEDFLKPYHISAYRLALDTGMSQTRVSEIVRGKRSITPETAMRLGRYFGTSVDFWLNIQMHYDLCTVDDTTAKQIAKIRTLKSILGSKKNDSEIDTADPHGEQLPTLRPA